MSSTPSDSARETVILQAIVDATGPVELIVAGENVTGAATVNHASRTVTVVDTDGTTWTVRGDTIHGVGVGA